MMGQQNKAMTGVGWTLAVFVGAMMTFSAGLKLMQTQQVVEQLVGHFAYPEYVLLPIGFVELSCVALYLIPRTAVLGAVLLTGYLGGATATHLRVGEGFVGPVVFGMLVWLALFLRDPRIRALLPIRFAPKSAETN